MDNLKSHRITQKIPLWIHENRLVLIFLGLFLLNLLLVSPDFNSQYWRINHFDEAKYIDSGRSLVNGEFRGLEWGPALSFLYGIIYLFVKHSEYWFFYSLIIGRVFIFTLLWLSVIRLARNAGGTAVMLLVAGLFLATKMGTSILSNSSDSLFAAMSAFALSNILNYRKIKNPTSLVLAGVFIGISIMARNDGWILLLFGILLFF